MLSVSVDEAAPVAPWRSRIVGHGEENPAELTANPLNWRIHPGQQRQAVMEALDQVGWVQEVVVNRTTGNLLDGHLRVEIALDRGEPTVPVQYVELSEEEERLVLASLDSLAALAVPNSDNLAALLDGLAVQGDALAGVLADLQLGAQGMEPTRATNPSEEDFWPRITVQVPPRVHAAWNAAMSAFEGEGDHERVAGMLGKLGYMTDEDD